MERRAAAFQYGPNTRVVERLLSDARVLGPSGIERIAWAWKRYTAPAHQECDDALDAARLIVAESGLEAAAEAAEADIRALTEGHNAQEAWKAEAGEGGRTAEDALLHAALALVTRDRVDEGTYRTLVKPMSEALPWLLPDEPPDRYQEPRWR